MKSSCICSCGEKEEALKMLQEHWADKSLEDYAKSNKIEVAVYCIPKM